MKLETLATLFNGTARNYPMAYSEAKAHFVSVDGALYCVNGDGTHSKLVTEGGYIQRWELFKALDNLNLDRMVELAGDVKPGTEDWLDSFMQLLDLILSDMTTENMSKMLVKLCELENSSVLVGRNARRFIFDRFVTVCIKANTQMSNFAARRSLETLAGLEGVTMGTVMSRYYNQAEDSEDMAECFKRQAMSFSYFEKLCIGGAAVAALVLAYLLTAVSGSTFAEVFALAIGCAVVFTGAICVSGLFAQHSRKMYMKAENIIEYWNAADYKMPLQDIELFQKAIRKFRRAQFKVAAKRAKAAAK